jgi:hypothetical protein
MSKSGEKGKTKGNGRVMDEIERREKIRREIDRLVEKHKEDLEKLNEKYMEKGDKKVTLEITDELGRKTTIEISASILETIKYAGENQNMDYQSIKEEMKKLKEEIEMLENEGKDNAQILAFIHLIEKAIETLALNICIEYRGNNEFQIREEFKRDFNWEELKNILSAILTEELGYEVVIEEADISKVLKHVEEVFLDLESYGINIVDKEGQYTALKARHAGSHVVIEEKSEVGQVKEVSVEQKSLRMKKDPSELYEKALEAVNKETREALGDEQVKTIISTLVKVYKKTLTRN